MKNTSIIWVLLLAFFQEIIAQPGTIDLSFGNNGRVTNAIDAQGGIQKIKVQKDHKIVVLKSNKDADLYDITLTRYLTDGLLDTDFGDHGVVKTKLNTSDLTVFNGIFFQLDQKILITGNTSRGDGIIVRYLVDGTLDTSFGDDGILILSTPYYATTGILVQTDGKYLVANITDRIFAVTRFNKDGTLDSSFGTGGTASTLETTSRQSFNWFIKMLLTKENNIVLIGTHAGGGLAGLFYFQDIIKFDSTGEITNSYYEYLQDSNNVAYDATLDEASNIYVTTEKGGVFKLDTHLDLDTTFGAGGSLQISPDHYLKINTYNDNDIIISYNGAITGSSSYMKKYTTDGILDPSFGTAGTVTLPENTRIRTISIQKNKKILVGGTTISTEEGTDNILLRYHGEESEEEESPITCFTLIDAKTNAPLLILEDGKSYPLNNIALNLFNIEAQIAANQTFKSYVLKLTGPVTISRTENVAPYAIFGDIAGNFFGKALPEGSYTIEAIPFSESNAKGTSGIPLMISFELVNAPSVIESFALIEADSGTIVAGIKEDDELELDEDLSYAIIANTSPKIQGSVAMELSGPVLNSSRTENQVPYTIFGDINGTIFGKRFSAGDYTISATPFTGGNGTGIAGEKSTVNFSISFFFKSIVLPNPIAFEIVEVYFGERIPDNDYVHYAVYTSSGIEIDNGYFLNHSSNYSYTIDLTGKLPERGVYILQFGPDRIQFVH